MSQQDNLRAQLAHVLCPTGTTDGGRGLDCVTHTRIADRLLPFITDLLSSARAEGAAEALHYAADFLAIDPYLPARTVAFLRGSAEIRDKRAAALSGITPTAGASS